MVSSNVLIYFPYLDDYHRLQTNSAIPKIHPPEILLSFPCSTMTPKRPGARILYAM